MSLLQPSAARTLPLPDTGEPVRLGAALWLAGLAAMTLLFFSIDLSPAWPTPLTSYGWRAATLLIVVTLMFCVRFRLAPAGSFLLLFAPWLTATILIALARPGDAFTGADLIRQVIMLVTGALVFAGAQNEAGRAFLRLLMWLLVGILIGLCIGPAIDIFMQWGWSWDRVRMLKSLMRGQGLLVNNNFAALATLLIALWPERRRAAPALWPLALLAFLAGSIYFGVRAPMAAAAFAIVAAFVFQAVRGREPGAPAPLLAPFLVLAIPLAALVLITYSSSAELTRLLTLRSYLWQIAFEVWRQHPIFGSGGEPLLYGRTNVLNSANFELSWHRDAVITLGGGGFHNVWLETLAGKGLVGFTGLFASQFLLFRLAMSRADTRGMPLLILLLLMLWRSHVELDGLFSRQNGALDLVSYIALAYCAALVLQDRAPEQRRGFPGVQAPRRANLAPPSGRI